jgi:hypothetical protein
VQAGDPISYNVSVLPPVPINYKLNGNTSLTVGLEYNLEYDLSVEADVHCESNATAFITLTYGEIFINLYSTRYVYVCRLHNYDSIKLDALFTLTIY